MPTTDVEIRINIEDSTYPVYVRRGTIEVIQVDLRAQFGDQLEVVMQSWDAGLALDSIDHMSAFARDVAQLNRLADALSHLATDLPEEESA